MREVGSFEGLVAVQLGAWDPILLPGSKVGVYAAHKSLVAFCGPLVTVLPAC